MYRSASTPVVPTTKTAADELGQALNRHHRKFYANNINDEALVPMFQEWAKNNLCAENVEFFLEVATYKRAASKRGHKVDIKKEADAIFHKYISLGAPQEINISYVVRVHILRYIGEPNAKTFDEAQAHILELMEIDVVPRFFRSPEFLARYRPVPDPLPPLKKTNSKSSSDTKSRSASLKSYFRKVMPTTNTRSGRSQSNIDDTLADKISDMSGDESPYTRSRSGSISDESPHRSRASSLAHGDESPRRARSRSSSISAQGEESPRMRSRTISLANHGDVSPRGARRVNGDESPRSTRAHTLGVTDEVSLEPVSPRSPRSPRSTPLNTRPSSYSNTQKDAHVEKEKRSNSFPNRVPGVSTLRNFAKYSKLFTRKSGEMEDAWDDEAWSPSNSPRGSGSPATSPREYSATASPATTPRDSPVTAISAPSSRPVSPRPSTPHTPRKASVTQEAIVAPTHASAPVQASTPAPASAPAPAQVIVPAPTQPELLPAQSATSKLDNSLTNIPTISIDPPTNSISVFISSNASTLSTFSSFSATSTMGSSTFSSPSTSPFVTPTTSPSQIRAFSQTPPTTKLQKEPTKQSEPEFKKEPELEYTKQLEPSSKQEPTKPQDNNKQPENQLQKEDIPKEKEDTSKEERQKKRELSNELLTRENSKRTLEPISESPEIQDGTTEIKSENPAEPSSLAFSPSLSPSASLSSSPALSPSPSLTLTSSQAPLASSASDPSANRKSLSSPFPAPNLVNSTHSLPAPSPTLSPSFCPSSPLATPLSTPSSPVATPDGLGEKRKRKGSRARVAKVINFLFHSKPRPEPPQPTSRMLIRRHSSHTCTDENTLMHR